MSPWLRIPLLILTFFMAIVIALTLWIFVTLLLNRRRLRGAGGALALARKIAGREGELVNEGTMSIWYSGDEDPVRALREEAQCARQRFETMVGEIPVVEPPYRVFVFHDRSVFLRFHMKITPGVDFASHDGTFFGHPYRIFTVCTAPAPCRIADASGTTRSFTTYALLEAIWGPGAPAWLQHGLKGAVANSGEPDGQAHLNRKMLASLSRGTALSVELFTWSLNDLFRLTRKAKDPAQSQRLRQFTNQSWSVVEFLWGDRAPRDLSSSLGEFLRDPHSKTNQGESFRLHLGMGFETVLDGWRQWVLEQGIGTYEPPPDPIRDGLLERVLPVIRDPKAKRGDWIAAIREWASVGYVLGADTLIDLLRESDDLPREEIAWALGMVSGMEWHEDPDRWQAWWQDLALACREPSEITPSRPDGPHVTPRPVASEVTLDPGPADNAIGDGSPETPPFHLA